MSITERQKQLLLAIIREFIDSGEAVGSISLQDKYNFKVSPATIRNEMSELVDLGFLFMKHSSGGRIPTNKAWKYYIESISDELENIDIVTRERIKVELNKDKFNIEVLIRNALKYLSQYTGNTSVALVGESVYYAGLSDMLNIPEFQEVDALKGILKILEDYSKLSVIFNQNRSDKDVQVLVGEETGLDLFRDYSIVFSELRLQESEYKGYLAVIGPNRMRYSQIIPSVKYIADTISQLHRGW